MNISFDNVSLMNDPFIVDEITNDDVPNRQVFLSSLARQRGGNLLNTEYNPKAFKMSGHIVGATASDLDDHKDEFRELLSRAEKNLDISYGAGTRRYIATATKITMPGKYYHLTYIPFEVEFIVPSGIGTDITETTATTTGVATLIAQDTLSILGSVRPKVKTTLNITAASGITGVSFLCNGDKITLTNAVVAGDAIVIDENALKITLNGVNQPYIGIFPQFGLGANVYSIEFTGTSISYSRELTYIKSYI